MKGRYCSGVIAAPVMAVWLVSAQNQADLPAQTNLPTASDPPKPVIAVSPGVLDFGLVGVGKTKQLALTVQNLGGGILNGTATVAAPFSLSGNAYYLQRNQSQTISVRFTPTAEGVSSNVVSFSGGGPAAVRVSGLARSPPKPPGKPRVISKTSTRFTEEEDADFIVKYYSDQTSYLLKPAMMDGAFRSVCDRALALKVAEKQPRRELAAVILVHYPTAASEEPPKLAWLKDLRALGYQRVVFLRGTKKMEVNGLTILESPRAQEALGGP